MPITIGGGNIIYLKDIAEVSRAQEDATAIGRFDGNDTIILSLSRNQKYTAVDVSRQATQVMEELEAENPNIELRVINDSADQIISSVKSVVSTMALAIVISTLVLYLFFGDVKASLIVATSIPISILAAVIMMWFMGYSTMSSPWDQWCWESA